MSTSRERAVANLEQEIERLTDELNALAQYEKPFFNHPETGQKWETAPYRASLSRRLDEAIRQITMLQNPVRRVNFKRPI